MKYMFKAYQILPCKEVVFIKGDHRAVLSHQLQCGLYKKVVIKRWPPNKGFTLGYSYMMICPFPFPVFSISTVSDCPFSCHTLATPLIN